MIETRIEGAVGWITLNDPERHNALSRDAIADLISAFDALEAEPALRVLLLTGRGRSFCAGAALGDVAEEDWIDNPLTPLCARVAAARLPVIAALNGGVYGGGVELALAADLRIGVAGMKAFVPAAELGIHYPLEGLARAVAVLGLQTARRIFLFAERFDDRALERIGFLDVLTEPDVLMDVAAERAEAIAALAPKAVQGMKASLTDHISGTADTQTVRDRIADCFGSEDFGEAMQARKDKRAAVFKGR